MVAFTFDATKVEPSGGGIEIWPTGWYPVEITKTEMKATQDKTGHRLVIYIKAIDGPSAGKSNIIGLNVGNNNQQAVEIAYRNLSAICWCTGVHNLSDTDQLVGQRLQAYAVVGERSNEWKNFKDMSGNEAIQIATGKAQPSQQQPQGPQSFGGGAPAGQPGGQPAWGGGAQPAQNPAPGPGGWGGGGAPAQQTAAPQPGGWQQPGGQPAQEPQPQQQPAQQGWGQPGGAPAAQPGGGPAWGAPGSGAPASGPAWGGQQ